MRRVALKGILWRRTRAILTALAIVLGVAMVSGTFVLTDTISKAFDGIFSSSYRNTSAVISGRPVVDESASGNATVPASLLLEVRRLPSVAVATGAIFDVQGNSDSVKLLDQQGKSISGNAPSFGFGIDTSQTAFNPLTLKEGRWASSERDVVIDADTARKEHFRVGDAIGASAEGPTRRFRITGVAKFGSLDSLGGATIAVFTVPTAQALLDKRGRFDTIALKARPGVTQGDLVARVRPLLPASARVQSASQQAKANAKQTKTFTDFIQYFLLAFGLIALLVGSFVIFNTLSITVAQRAREFATLRTLGASRRQVLRSVLLEGLVIGVLASVTGLFLGLLLARGLSSIFAAFGLDLPQAGTVFKGRTVVVSLLVGILVTVLSSIAPARRATRIAPIAAVREGARLPGTKAARRAPVAALVTLVLALFLIGVGTLGSGLATGTRLLATGVGVLALFAGVSLVASRLVRPLAALVGAPARRLGGSAGRLAADNATRNPGRTATTAAALMIGLALITLVATLGQGLRSSDADALRDQVTADYVVTSKNGFDPVAAAAGRAVASAPGVRAASSVRFDRAKVLGKGHSVNGIDPRTISETANLHLAEGGTSLRALGADGALVRKSFADEHHLHPGSSLRVTTPAGRRLSLRVRAISSPPAFDSIDPVFADIAIPQAAFDAGFPRPKDSYTFVNTAQGAPAAGLRRALAPFPDARLHTRAGWVQERSSGVNQLLNILYVLLALSVVVSLFGMVNTLVLAVFERTRELGMLRAIGMTRRQIRRMVRQESVITALIGAALGLPLGLFLAAAVTRALSGDGLSFSVPVGTLVAFALLAVLAGLAAAILPARRAARLDVLRALSYE